MLESYLEALQHENTTELRELGQIKGLEASLQHLEIPPNMETEVLSSLVKSNDDVAYPNRSYEPLEDDRADLF